MQKMWAKTDLDDQKLMYKEDKHHKDEKSYLRKGEADLWSSWNNQGGTLWKVFVRIEDRLWRIYWKYIKHKKSKNYEQKIR